MRCELTGMPENQIDPPDDELAPDTPQEKVWKYLNGENVQGVNVYDYNDKDLAAHFRTLINVYRDFEFSARASSIANKLALLAEIKDCLTDSMLELTDET